MDRPVKVGSEQMNIGTTYLNLGDYGESEKWLTNALKTFTDSKYVPGQGQVNLNLGNLMLSKGNDKSALLYYQTAKKIFKRLGNRRNEIFSLAQIASVKKTQGYFKESRQDFKAAIVEYKDMEDIEGWVLSEIELADIDRLENNLDDAIERLKRTKPEIYKHELSYALYYANQVQAYCYLALHQPELAEPLIDEDSEYAVNTGTLILLPAMLAYEQKEMSLAVKIAQRLKIYSEGSWTTSQQNILDAMQKAYDDKVWVEIKY